MTRSLGFSQRVCDEEPLKGFSRKLTCSKKMSLIAGGKMDFLGQG